MTQKEQITNIFPAELNAVIDAYADIQGVEGILLFGSRAMELGDAKSDYDFYVICSSKIPSVRERKRALGKIKGIRCLVFEALDSNGGWIIAGEKFGVRHYRIDCGYQKITWLHAVVREVRKKGSLSLPQMPHKPYTILGLLENSFVLYDRQGKVAKLLRRLRPFPARLKRNLIRKGIRICGESLAEMEEYNRRAVGNTAFLFHLNRGIDGVGSILFAVNERYDPATKRVEDVYKTLPLKPVRFLSRYRRILAGPFTRQGRKQGLRILQGLVVDVKKLIPTG